MVFGIAILLEVPGSVDHVDVPATIAAIGAVISAIGVILIAYWAYRGKVEAEKAAATALQAKSTTEDNNTRLIVLDQQVFKLGKQVDGQLTALLELTEKAAHAAGKLEGQRDEKMAQSRLTTDSEIRNHDPVDPSR
jgi:hypothetical protein